MDIFDELNKYTAQVNVTPISDQSYVTSVRTIDEVVVDKLESLDSKVLIEILCKAIINEETGNKDELSMLLNVYKDNPLQVLKILLK